MAFQHFSNDKKDIAFIYAIFVTSWATSKQTSTQKYHFNGYKSNHQLCVIYHIPFAALRQKKKKIAEVFPRISKEKAKFFILPRSVAIRKCKFRRATFQLLMRFERVGCE
jgi:hypothetical protein